MPQVKLVKSASAWYDGFVAAIAQLVERIHGKDEVTSSNLVRGSIRLQKLPDRAFFVSRSINNSASTRENALSGNFCYGS